MVKQPLDTSARIAKTIAQPLLNLVIDSFTWLLEPTLDALLRPNAGQSYHINGEARLDKFPAPNLIITLTNPCWTNPFSHLTNTKTKIIDAPVVWIHVNFLLDQTVDQPTLP